MIYAEKLLVLPAPYLPNDYRDTVNRASTIVTVTHPSHLQSLMVSRVECLAGARA